MVDMHNTTRETPQPWVDGRSYWSSFELYPNWRGRTFFVFKGYAYHDDFFSSQKDVVVKTYRRNVRVPESDWNGYLLRTSEAKKLAALYNDWLSAHDLPVVVEFVNPIVTSMKSVSCLMGLARYFKKFKKKISHKEHVLIEECIREDFKTFVTDEGECDVEDVEFLEAFCHFTHHQSNGEYVLCNLRGAYSPGKVLLTNPTIHSNDESFGTKDDGRDGILQFFNNHTCSKLCENWPCPVSDAKSKKTGSDCDVSDVTVEEEYDSSIPDVVPVEVHAPVQCIDDADL